jgi:uncharacterized protein
MLMRELELSGTPIDGYGVGGFRIGGEWYKGSILVTSTKVHTCDYSSFEKSLIDADSLLLIGTGREMSPLPAALKDYLYQNNITYDMMQTSSACRTYNVLQAEERPVSALLIAV